MKVEKGNKISNNMDDIYVHVFMGLNVRPSNKNHRKDKNIRIYQTLIVNSSQENHVSIHNHIHLCLV